MSTLDDGSTPGGGWDNLLDLLAASRVDAAEKYRQLRARLGFFFRGRGLVAPDDLVDETLTRVARNLAAGEQIRAGDPVRYVAGVARLVALEAGRAAGRQRPLDEVPDATPSPDEPPRESRLHTCLDRCLNTIPEPSRGVLLDYQIGEGGGRIDNRKRLARRLGVTLNTLRARVFRLRAQLESCIEDCLAAP